MRISDWSSDVCSSDLAAERVAIGQRYRHRRIDHAVDLEQLLPHRLLQAEDVQRLLLGGRGGKALALEDLAHRERFPARQPPGLQDGHRPREVALGDRSEERRVGKGCVSKVRTGGW